MVMYSIEQGFGIFDTGASGFAVSKYSLDTLESEEPDSFGELDTHRRKLMGFGGGTNTYSLGMKPQTVKEGPLRGLTLDWDVTDNPNTSDKTPHSYLIVGLERTV